MSAATNRSKCWPVERKDVLACLNGSIPRGIKLVVFFHPLANIKFSMAPCFNLMEPYLNILQGLGKIAKNGLMLPTVLTGALEDLIKLRPQLVDPGLPLSIHIPSWGHQLSVLMTWCRKLVDDLAWKRMLRWVGSGHEAQIHQLQQIVASLVVGPAEVGVEVKEEKEDAMQDTANDLQLVAMEDESENGKVDMLILSQSAPSSLFWQDLVNPSWLQPSALVPSVPVASSFPSGGHEQPTRSAEHVRPLPTGQHAISKHARAQQALKKRPASNVVKDDVKCPKLSQPAGQNVAPASVSAPADDKKAPKMEYKNVYSRRYHHILNKMRKTGLADEDCKKKAREEGHAFAEAWLASCQATDSGN